MTAQGLFEPGWYDPSGTEVIPGEILTSRGCPARFDRFYRHYIDDANLELDFSGRPSCAPSSEFRRLREHPAIRRILGDLVEGSAQSGLGDTCRIFSPGCPELTTRHQDRFYVRGDPGLWTVRVPLGDRPVELGGLAVLPGSHRQGLRPHAGTGAGRQGVDMEPDLVWAGADYRTGDVLMFHGLTLHRALDNRSEARLRVSADFRYAPAQGPPAS